jgi:hypothetical protein
MNTFLALGFMLAVAMPASAAKLPDDLPPCPPGWDGAKWKNPDVQSPKYVVGRIIAAYPHTPAGLKAAMPQIALIYEGSKVLPGKGDVALITCVGEIDLVVAAGGPEGGIAWAWQVNKDLCGSCSPQLCSPGAPSSPAGDSGGHSGTDGTGGTVVTDANGNVVMPSMLKIVQHSAAAHPKVWVKTTDTHTTHVGAVKEETGSRDCAEALDYALTELHRADPRWGYDCKDEACKARSGKTAAYYSGTGEPHEGATERLRVKIIDGYCDERAHAIWEKQIDHPAGYWSTVGLVKDDADAGHCAWRKENLCIREGGAEIYVESRTGNSHADCAKGPGPGFTEHGSSWVRMIGNHCP